MADETFMEKHFSGPARRKQVRDEMSIRKRESDLKLKQAGFDPKDLSVVKGSKADVEQQDRDLQLTMLKAMQGKMAGQESDVAMEEFAMTGDANNLQKALDNNQYLKQTWRQKGVHSIANIDWGNDAKLLARIGFKPHEYDTPEKQSILKKNAYKFYNGKNWNIGLINDAASSTGAVRRMGSRRSDVFARNQKEMRDLLAGPKTSANTAEGHKYEYEINEAAEMTGVPANLLASMMNVESNGRADAVSPKGATGLMQLMPETAKEMGVRDITNPHQNILGGAHYMKQLLEKYNGDTRLALAAYNAGPGNVDKHNGIPPFSETQQYIGKVLKNYAAGESYYQPGKEAISGFDMRADISRGEQTAQNKIATIQAFYREQAAVAKGTSYKAEEKKLELKEREIQAKNIASAVKLKAEGRTTKQKDIEAARRYTGELVDNFKGETEFFKTDFSLPENFNKAWPDVMAIMKLEGTELTAADKKSITESRELIALAGPAIKLTKEQVGVVDKTIENVKKHIAKHAKGVDAIAAIEAFRNTLRHALYGSALTAGEIQSFNSAYGSNRQGLASVLKQFKVALSQVKTKLDSQVQLGNPYTNKVMLGADQEKMNNIMTAIQERIDYAEGIYRPTEKDVTPKVKETTTKRPLSETIR